MFKHVCWLDFETRSRVDLRTHGAYRYIDCPDHRILVAGYALDNEEPESALIGPNGRMPPRLANMLADPQVQVRAHNAAFDRLQLGREAPPIERWYCTASQARAAALPGKLEDLGRAMGADLRKDVRGSQLIQLLSIPDRTTGRFNDDPSLMAEFARYCAQDIRTMRAASLNMPQLSDEDLRVYWASERVNDRGLPIDVELCRLALQYAEIEKREAAEAVVALSAGAVRSVQGPKLTAWVHARLDPTLRRHMEKTMVRKAGVARRAGGANDFSAAGGSTFDRVKASEAGAYTETALTLATDIRANLLEIAAENPDAIDPDTVAMIEAAEAGSMSSTAKFKTMLDRVGDDGRLRGAFVFNGAYQTNRWSSTGAQVHNFPRLVAEDPEAVLKLMRHGRALPGVLRTLKSMLRPAIAPRRGRVIVRSDWSAVEARGLPWLVDNDGARRYLGAFSDPDRDIYVEQSEAAGLGGARQPGKVVVLSLGYGGGEGALTKMAKNYGVQITDRDGVVRRWRNANPWVADKRTGWWASLARCAMNAMESPGKTFRAGRVVLSKQGDDLTMRLPSGRTMHYPMARAVEGQYGDEIEYLKASWKPTADAKHWPTARLWHGVLAENATQAACADLLREALVRAQDAGLEVIGHVHDEIIMEAPAGRAAAAGRALERCMLAAPAWATGFPLKVETDISPRFRK